MPRLHALPVSVRVDPVAHIDTDLLAVPVFEQDDPGEVAGLDVAMSGEWSRARASGELSGQPLEQLVAPVASSFAAHRVLLVGAGPRGAFNGDVARRIAAVAGLLGRQRKTPRVAVLLRGIEAEAGQGDRALARVVQSAAEGLTLAQLETAIHRSAPSDRAPLTEVAIVVAGATEAEQRALQGAADRGRVLGECTNQARHLGNEPANVLTPRALAERAESLAAGTDLEVDVLDGTRIAELGMGLFLGVARGSAEPPRLVVMRHTPEGAVGPLLGFVGKGITFDTGGISIKPADGMERMKVDMGGAAAVIGAMRALAVLHAPVRVLAVIPITENMPGGRAMRPGDILRSASGKTVEVVNTDAEGRLVLGDALWYARELGATHLVDLATLTGACVVALGRSTSGLFGRPDDWVHRVREAGARAGERHWPMPVFDDYFEQMKSETADMTNTGGRPAGSVTAALFLKQFVGDLPWAHLDIAGTAWVDEAKPWQTKGATGVGVRTLAELALSFCD